MQAKLESKPVKVYLDTMNAAFGFDANDTCVYLLVDAEVPWFSGKRTVNPRAIAEDPDRFRLHKRLKDKLPGEQPLEIFDPFAQSIPALFSAVLTRVQHAQGLAEPSAIEYVQRTVIDATPAFAKSLQVYTRGADIYDNLLDGVRASSFRTPRDRALAAFMLFTEAGMIGDPMVFGPMVEKDIRTVCGVGVLNVAPLVRPSIEGDDGADLSQATLAIQRVHEGGVRGRRHTLDPAGTLIGSMPITEGSYCADVDRTASFEHLRIYQEDSAWYAEGLGAEYGTYLHRIDSAEPVVIEPPLAEQATWNYAPVQILPGDLLILGTTFFEVQLFQRGE